jgi:hypothetical protein
MWLEAYGGRTYTIDQKDPEPISRAWRTKAKVKARLLGDADPDKWDLPPRPKGMKKKTYERWEARYDEAEEMLEEECALALARLAKWGL